AGGDPGDWAELYNAGTDPVDISGWVFRDNMNADSSVIPANTTLAAGAYYVIEESTFTGGWGLGGSDMARLFKPDGTTLVDSYTWTPAAGVTYGRCPNGTGSFVNTAASTKGAANSCP